jgi:hypothetical protein
MSILSLSKKLVVFEQQRRDALKFFDQQDSLIIGSITQTKGRCGKPNCECAQKPSHPITLLMTTANGKKRSQLVRKQDIEGIMALWQRYKKLVAALKYLKNLQQKEIILLKQIIRERSINYR